MFRKLEDKKFIKIAFSVFLLLILQWNLACSRKSSSSEPLLDSGGSDIPLDFDTGTSSTGDDFDFSQNDDLFIPTTEDDIVSDFDVDDIADQVNICAPNLSDPYSNDLSGFSNTFGCVDDGLEQQQQALQMLLLQSLNSFEYMDQCFQAVAQRMPRSGASQQEMDISFLTAQLGLVRCYRQIQDRITTSVPWIQQAQQQSSQNDALWYFMLMNVMGNNNGF